MRLSECFIKERRTHLVRDPYPYTCLQAPAGKGVPKFWAVDGGGAAHGAGLRKIAKGDKCEIGCRI